jgi:hypothetical protein
MICRLFAFSGKQKGSYFPCRVLQSQCSEQVAYASRLISQGMPLPVYAEMYQKLCKIDFPLATDMHPFTDSVDIALRERERIERGEYPTPLPMSETASVSVWIRQRWSKASGVSCSPD